MLSYRKQKNRKEIKAMGYKIKEIREEIGMTQAELSIKSGVSRTIINGLETGRTTTTTTDTLKKIAAALDKKVSEIFLTKMLNMLSVKKGENHMGNQIYKEISKFAEMQRDEIKREKAKKKRKSVCIDPDSVIGKEIMYQTALLHEILDEIRGGKTSP